MLASLDSILPVLGVLGVLGTVLGIYLKGRSDGKAKGENLIRDAELAAREQIIKENNRVTKQRNERNKAYKKAHSAIDNIYSTRVRKQD